MIALSESIGNGNAVAAARCVQSRALSRCLELPVLGGNRVEVLDAVQAAAALREAIERAGDHINIGLHEWPAGEPGEQWVGWLLARARQGVHVNLMLDARAATSSLQQRLRRGGIRLCEAPAALAWARWPSAVRPRDASRGLFVIDGRVAFIGPLESTGSDPDAEVDAPHGVLVEGPAVAELQWLFIDDWRQCSLVPLQTGRYFPALPWVGGQRVGIALAEHDGDRAAYARTLLAAVDAAQDRVLLVVHGRPDTTLERALVAACSRGIDVHLLWTGALARRRLLSMGWASLLQAGIHIHELTDGAPRAHANVIDGVWSSIEAAGAAARSGAAGRDHLIVLDAQFGAQAEAAFWSDVARANAVAPPTRSLSPLQRLNTRLARYLEVSW